MLNFAKCYPKPGPRFQLTDEQLNNMGYTRKEIDGIISSKPVDMFDIVFKNLFLCLVFPCTAVHFFISWIIANSCFPPIVNIVCYWLVFVGSIFIGIFFMIFNVKTEIQHAFTLHYLRIWNHVSNREEALRYAYCLFYEIHDHRREYSEQMDCEDFV